MSRNYVSKKKIGVECPEIVKGMQIGIKPHKRDNDSWYTDIIFKNSSSDVADKNYVAYDPVDDKIYFKFYKCLSYDASDDYKFKMFSSGSDNLRTINVCRDSSMLRFWTNLWYPIYYLPSSDEYFIDSKDVKRRSLLMPESETTSNNSNLYQIIYNAVCDAIKNSLLY